MIEALAARGHGECARSSSVKLPSQGDDGVRRQMMGKAGLAGGKQNLFAAHFAGRAGAGRSGIYEDYRLEAADSFRQFRRKLMEAEDFNVRFEKFSFQFVGSAPG
jgi:hypothetical protein